MALRPVVNRCANSTVRIDHLFPLDKGFGGLVSFTLQSASAPHSAAEISIDSIVTGVSGTPMRGSFTGTAAISSTTSVPEVT